MAEAANRPAKTLGPVWTGSGFVEVAVWAKPGQKRTKHSVTFRRTYNSEGTWKETQTLFDGDLLPLARLLGQAWEWIVAEQSRRDEPS